MIYFCHDKWQIERVVLVRKYGNKYNIFKCKFSENRGVWGPNIDQNACGDFFLKMCIWKLFSKGYFKSGPRVHRTPRFWATDRRKFAWHFACRKYAFWRSCLPRKESHTALILYFDWLMFYAKNEAADIFFVMKQNTGRISLFHAAL